MGDALYKFVVACGRHVFWLSSRPMVIGAAHARRAGPFIVAATHSSPYDVPILMRHVPRPLDFVSSVEVLSRPLVGRFYRALNAFPLDRSTPDPSAVRTILARLARGRVVAIFPEGAIKRESQAVYHTRQIKSGIGRIARMAGAPIVPVVIQNSIAYARAPSWLPTRGVKYGVIFGEPIAPPNDHEGDDERVEAMLVDAYVALHRQLRATMDGAAVVSRS